MNSYQTPIKQKLIQFRNQIRNQQLSKMKMTVRTINIETSKKQAQNEKFKQIIKKLDMNYEDHNAFQQLRHMFKYEGLIIGEKKCLTLLLIIEQLMKRAERKGECFTQQDNQKAIQQLYAILKLLTHNADKYPQYGCYKNPEILNTMIFVLKTSTSEKIRKQTLRLCNFLVLNVSTKPYFLRNGFLSLLAHKTFASMSQPIETLLCNIFNNRDFKYTRQNIIELIKLFTFEGSQVFSNLQQNESVQCMYHFIRCFCKYEQLNEFSEGVMELSQFGQLMIVLLKRLQLVDVMKDDNRKCYIKMIRAIAEVMKCCDVDKKENEISLMLHHLDKMWAIHSEVFILYQQVVKQIQDNPQYSQQRLKPLNQQRQHCEQTINSFIQLFELCIIKLPHQDHVNILKNEYFHQFHKKFITLELMTIQQFRILLKYGPIIRRQNYEQLINWYQNAIENDEVRIMCLKILSHATRNGEIEKIQFFRLGDVYERKRVNFAKRYHQLTEFIFLEWPIPTLEDIEQKQYKIRIKQQERLRIEKEENEKIAQQQRQQKLRLTKEYEQDDN